MKDPGNQVAAPQRYLSMRHVMYGNFHCYFKIYLFIVIIITNIIYLLIY